MADELNLSLWFPSFTEAEMMPRALSVLRQFPFSQARPGITAAAAYPLSWSETPVYSHSFDFPVQPDRAVAFVTEFLHDDYAYEFETLWDLWVPGDAAGRPLTAEMLRGEEEAGGSPLGAMAQAGWLLHPSTVKIVAQGLRFEDGEYQQSGHILLKLGRDAPFLAEEEEFDDAEMRVRSNVQKLIQFTSTLEKNCGISGRVLWSESEESLAQKLVARLQRVQ
jgi:hypothetical protein